ncbi:MAG: hypothetical protein ACI353_05210 [Alloprevotella sp.]
MQKRRRKIHLFPLSSKYLPPLLFPPVAFPAFPPSQQGGTSEPEEKISGPEKNFSEPKRKNSSELLSPTHIPTRRQGLQDFMVEPPYQKAGFLFGASPALH